MSTPAEAMAITAVLRDLEAPHFRSLEAFDAAQRGGALKPDEVYTETFGSTALYEYAIAALVRHGVVERFPETGPLAAGSGMTHRVTDFGSRRLDHLRSA